MTLSELVKEIKKEKVITIVALSSIVLILACLLILLIYLLIDTADTQYITPVTPEPIIIEDTIEISSETRNVTQRGTEKTDDDILAELCMGEAGNQPMIGKIAVIVTVLNRAKTFDLSIKDVVTAKGQYDGYPYKGIITNECYEAVELAREIFELGVFPEDMLYFRTNDYHSFAEDYTQIGNHYFSTAK